MVDSGAFGRSREGGLAVNAMSAIDMALWDIAGKASGLPIYKLLGGAVQQEVMVYASTSAFAPEPSPLRRRPIDDIMRECRIYLEQGFKAIKLGWGNHFSPQDEETLSAVREAIGPDVHLMLDFGCPAYLTHGWTAKDAVRVTRIAEKYGIFFLEEALKPDDVDGFAELTANANIRIATGESLTTLTEFQRFFLPPSGRD
jgi:D-galactarolactone cycloisomerase